MFRRISSSLAGATAISLLVASSAFAHYSSTPTPTPKPSPTPTALPTPSNVLIGTHIMSAFGPSVLTGDNNVGPLAIAGLIDLNASGGANTVNLTLAYQEAVAGWKCFLTDPADVTYTQAPLANGIEGTLSVTVASDDACTKQFDGSNLTLEDGKGITFTFSAIGNGTGIDAKLIAVTSTLVDSVGLGTLSSTLPVGSMH